MTDREKILHELDHQVADADWCDNDWKDNVPIWMLRGALALLREQEPVKPKREVNENGQILSCGNCGAWFAVQKQKFCHECGRAVKWDE